MAREELVAEGMELVLTDGKVLEELSKTDKTLWEKIRDWFFDIIGQIRRSYESLNQASKTAQVLKETVESLEEIEGLFTESEGKIVDYQRNWKNRGYDTAVVVAPITIAGDEYRMGCVVIRAKEDNIFYLHEVAQIKKDGTPSFKTGSSNKSNPSEGSFTQTPMRPRSRGFLCRFCSNEEQNRSFWTKSQK